jgi:hypothetical protein
MRGAVDGLARQEEGLSNLKATAADEGGEGEGEGASQPEQQTATAELNESERMLRCRWCWAVRSPSGTTWPTEGLGVGAWDPRSQTLRLPPGNPRPGEGRGT